MDKNRIVHFVGFVTDLPSEDFIPLWKSYSKQLISGPGKATLQEASLKTKSKFGYVSQHESNSTDFRFAFMKENSQANFPERRAKVVQAGGYMPMQLQPRHNKMEDDVKVMVFASHSETDLDFYQRQTFHRLNIYEAYFENCAYSYVMEFYLDEQDVPTLLAQLKSRPGIETALYEELDAIANSKKVSGSLL